MRIENKKTNIPEGWKMTTLKEVSEFQRGFDLPVKNRTEGTYPLVASSGVDGLVNEYKVKGPGVVTGRSGTLGKVLFIKDNFWPLNTTLWIKDFKYNNEKFIYYWLLTIPLERFNAGSGVPTLNRNHIYEIEVVIPENKNEQQAIAAVLSSLDDKIELLREQNKTLEAIAQAIYKRWFVDFEFPVEEGNALNSPPVKDGKLSKADGMVFNTLQLKGYKSSGGKMVESELGEIPKGWVVAHLGDNIMTSLLKTGIDNFEGEKIYLDTASVQSSNIIDLKNKIIFEQRPSRANMQPKIHSIWFAKMKNSKKALFFDTYSEWELDNFILSTGFAGLDVKVHALYYLWNFIISDKFELEKDNFCNGTTMQAINNENIQKIKILIPAEEILILFSNIVRPLYKKIHLNWMSIQTLSDLRDSLLPKLISGKIRVSTTPAAEGCHPSFLRRGAERLKGEE